MDKANDFIKSNLKLDFQLTPLTGDAGSRQYFKVDTISDQNYILCIYKQGELTSFDHFLNVGSLFSTNHIKIPKIISKNKILGMMILQDLGSQTLEDEFTKNTDINYYFKSIDELIKIQSIKKTENSTAHSYRFTVEKFNWELSFAVEHLTKLYDLSADSIDLEILTYEFNDISTYLVDLPQMVVHRDYHSRNILIKDDTPHIIDFQDARLGNSFYDLSSLIEDSYTCLKSSDKNTLISYYKKESPLRFDKNFNFNYTTQALQRSFKACGSFASLKNLQGTDRYLPYLKPSLLNIKEYLNILNRHPELLKFIESCCKKEGL